ncbi:autotransporter-associated beta strand repeat-containing protein, partial [Methylocystis sp. B8]|uniref:beta strand repeat-containing protein n=1 Tax=Methylocystis sp. B8 TaxID=544938 RepID=UPI0014854A04
MRFRSRLVPTTALTAAVLSLNASGAFGADVSTQSQLNAAIAASANPINVTSGALVVSVGQTIASTTDLIVAPGASLDLSSALQMIGSLSGGGALTLGTSSLIVGGNNSSTSFSGTIGMTHQGYESTYGRFFKTGTGTLTIDNATFSLGESYIAQGAMAQTSGNTSFAYLSVGENKTGGVPNVGALNVSGGTLTIGTTLQVGSFEGNGTVNQTGGTVKVIPLCGTTAHCAALNIGNQGGTGTYAISGGELIASIVNIGRKTSGSQSSTGTLAISGGVVDISTRSDGNGGILNGQLIIGYSAQSNGKIEQTGGTLRIHNDSKLYLTGESTSTSIYNLSGGTLEIGGSSLQAAYSNPNPHYQFNLGGGSIKVIESALTTNVNATLTSGVSTIDTNGFGATWSGVFSGSGGLAKAGAGTLTLSGANTYLGGTFLNDGILKVNADNNLGDATGGLTFSGGTLLFGAAFNTARNITLAGGGTIDTNGFNTTVSGQLSGAGGLTKTGVGALTLSGANTYLGGTFINRGVLKVNADNNLGDAAGGLTFDGGTLQFGAAFNSARNIALAGSGILDSNGFDASLSGQLNGQGALTKTGAGTLTLNGSSSYSGATAVNQGTLRAGATNAFSPLSAFSVASAATFDLNSLNQTIGSLAGAGNVLLGSATLTTGGDNSSTTFSGVASGNGQISKTGTGTFTLTGSNAYTGGTTVTGGLINFASANNFGPSGTITLNGGGLQWATGNTTDISSRLAAMGIGGATFDTNGNNVVFATSISGVGGLTKSGAGMLTLVANNTGPIAVTGGTLRAGQIDAFSPLSTFSVASAATFDLNNLNQTIGSLAGAGNVTLGSATLTTGGDGTSTTFSGSISGTGGLTKEGAGTFTLAGNNTYTGLTTINAGRLNVTGSIVSTIVNNGTFALDNSGTSTVSGVISGTGAIEKTGAGTTVLSNINTYTGATSVTDGKLVVNGSIASSSGLTVGQGAVIGGNGILPSATINGELSPGNSIGLITVVGDLTLGAGSQYLVEVSPVAADRANVTGAASLAGTVLATFARGTYIVKNYTILHADGGFAGSKFSGLVTANAPANFITSLNYTSNDVFLSLTANLGGDGPGGINALPRNQRGVANVINAWFNAGLPLAPSFINLYSLTGTGLTNALASSAGEPATGAQQIGYRSLDHFLYQMLDLQEPNRGQGQIGDASGFIASYTTDQSAASKKISLSHVDLSRSPQPNASALYEPRWSIWASPFGGY